MRERTGGSSGRALVVAGVAAVMAGALLIASAQAPRPAYGQGCGDAGPGSAPSELEAAVLCLINERRRSAGVPALTVNAVLSTVARSHAVAMERRNFFAEAEGSGPGSAERIRRAGYRSGTADFVSGELRAWGRGSSAAASANIARLAANPDFRRVMLDRRFRDVGVGTAPGAPEGADANSVTYAVELAGPAQPTIGREVVVRVVRGVVRVRLPGSGGFTRLTGAETVRTGSELDTTRGTVRLTSAVPSGTQATSTQTADFFDGRFRITQDRRTGLTDVSLRGGSFRRCNQRPRASGAVADASQTRRSRRRVRRLWGRGKGKFRTRGRFAAATVRGTTWLTEDRCDGTLIRVLAGSVDVRRTRGRGVRTVQRGQSFLVRRR